MSEHTTPAQQPTQQEKGIEMFSAVKERCATLFGSEDRFVKEATMLLQIIHDKPELQAATRQSVVAAMLRIATTSLTINPMMKECYVVTRRTKVRQPNGSEAWETRLGIEPSYIGLMRLATDTGAVKDFEAQVVWQGDVFEYDLVDKKPTKHVPYWIAGNPRGDLRGVYGFARLADGTIKPEHMGADEIALIMSKSEAVKAQRAKLAKGEAAGATVYDEWLGEMARKALVKRLQKWVPRTPNTERLMAAIEADNEGYDLADGRDSLSTLKRRVLVALEAYTGEDKEELRAMCHEKVMAGEFTEAFATNILQQIGA